MLLFQLHQGWLPMQRDTALRGNDAESRGNDAESRGRFTALQQCGPQMEELQSYRTLQKIKTASSKNIEVLESRSEVLLGLVSTVVGTLLFLLLVQLAQIVQATDTWDWGRIPPWPTGMPEHQLLVALDDAKLLPRSLTFSVTIMNLEYAVLHQDLGAQTAVEAAVRASVVAVARRLISAEQVLVRLIPGSVIAECTVGKLFGAVADRLSSVLEQGAPRLRARLVEGLKEAPALASMALGAFAVSELSAMRLHLHAAQSFDGDADGRVSLDEFDAGVVQLHDSAAREEAHQAFRHWDADGDEFLENSEFEDLLLKRLVSTTVSTTHTASTTLTTTSLATKRTTVVPVAPPTTTTTKATTTTTKQGGHRVAVVLTAAHGLNPPSLSLERRGAVGWSYRLGLALGAGVGVEKVMDLHGKAGCVSMLHAGNNSSVGMLAGCLLLTPDLSVEALQMVFMSTSGMEQISTAVRSSQPGAGHDPGGLRVAVTAHERCEAGLPSWSILDSVCTVSPHTTTQAPSTSVEVATTAAAAAAPQPAAARVTLRIGAPAAAVLDVQTEALLAYTFRRDLAYALGAQPDSVFDADGRRGCASVAASAATAPLARCAGACGGSGAGTGAAVVATGCLAVPKGTELGDVEAVLTSASEKRKLFSDAARLVPGTRLANVSVTVEALHSCQSPLPRDAVRGNSHCEDLSPQPTSTTVLALPSTTPTGPVTTTSSIAEATTTSTHQPATTTTSTPQRRSAMVRMRIPVGLWHVLSQERRAGIAWAFLNDLSYAMDLPASSIFSVTGRPGCVSIDVLSSVGGGSGGDAAADGPAVEGCLPMPREASMEDIRAVFESSSELKKVAQDIYGVAGERPPAGGFAAAFNFSAHAVVSCNPGQNDVSDVGSASMETYCQQEAAVKQLRREP